LDIKFDTYEALEEIKALIKQYIADYVALFDGLPSITEVYVSQDYSDSMKEKPYINVYPSQAEPEDAGQCMVADTLTIEVAVFVLTRDEHVAEKWMLNYGDCIKSLFSDHTETDLLFDIRRGTTEYWTNATTMEKMATIVFECSTRPASR
jgi:hypothetical protein